MRSFDVRHRCSDEQSAPIRVVHTSKSITGMLQRGVLMEAAAVLFWIDPHLGDPPRSRLVGGILFAPMEIARGTEARRGQLGHRVGDLCRHRYFCNLPVRTINSPRHKEGVRADGIALRTNTVTLVVLQLSGTADGTARRDDRREHPHPLPPRRPKAIDKRNSCYCRARPICRRRRGRRFGRDGLNAGEGRRLRRRTQPAPRPSTAPLAVPKIPRTLRHTGRLASGAVDGAPDRAKDRVNRKIFGANSSRPAAGGGPHPRALIAGPAGFGKAVQAPIPASRRRREAICSAQCPL